MKFSHFDVRLFVLTVLLEYSLCETETPILPTENLLETYKTNFETAISVEKSEKKSTKKLSDEFRISLVKKMTDYRLEMVVHRNHSFGQESNEKWLHCVNTKTEQIKQLEIIYSSEESECVSNANAIISDKRQALKQIIKEIRDWKKGYKYLQNLCRENYVLTKQDTGDCLVEYMQRDNYNTTIERLLDILKTSQSEFVAQTEECLASFDDCLRGTFSKYLTGLRKIRGVLNKCYKRANNAKVRMDHAVGCVDISKMSCVSE